MPSHPDRLPGEVPILDKNWDNPWLEDDELAEYSDLLEPLLEPLDAPGCYWRLRAPTLGD